MRFPLLSAFLLAGCAPEQDKEPGPPPLAEEALPEAPDGLDTLPIGARAPGSIEGEWRVAGINGAAVDMDWTPTGSIRETQIRLSSQCITFWRPYELDGTRLERIEKSSLDPSTTVPPPPCARGLRPEERAMAQALEAAELVYRLPDGALVIDGPGGSITLFTQ